jgi:CBS domain-containing protein
MKIHDVMTRDVVAVHPETPLKEVARLLVEHHIGGIPVVDHDNVVIGVVSESDFAMKERGIDYTRDSIIDRLAGRTAADEKRVLATIAGEAMSTPPITIEGRIASLREAAIVMLDRRVNRLPVTDDGRLIGIITRGDLVRVYAQPDETIATRLHDALRAVDGLIIEGVENGVVTLAGTVASLDLAAAAVRAAAAVDGVVAVHRERLVAMEELPDQPIDRA